MFVNLILKTCGVSIKDYEIERFYSMIALKSYLLVSLPYASIFFMNLLCVRPDLDSPCRSIMSCGSHCLLSVAGR
jgi:hypothetical protein